MVDESPKPKRRGRPRLPANEKKRHTMAFRLTSDVRDELERRSRESGRSISEEVERIISIDVGLQRERYAISTNETNNPIIARKNSIASALNDYHVLQSIIERTTADLGNLDNVCKTVEVKKEIIALMHYYFVFGRRVPEAELQEQYRDACIDDYIQTQTGSLTKEVILDEMRAVEKQAEKDREAADLAYLEIVQEKLAKRPIRK